MQKLSLVSRVSTKALILILAFQISGISQLAFIPSPLRTKSALAQSLDEGAEFNHLGDDDLSSKKKFTAIANGIESSSLESVPPKAYNHYLIGQQYYRRYEPRTDSKGNNVDVAVEEINFSKPTSKIPSVSVVNYSRELRIVYDRENNELRIEKFLFDQKLKRLRVTDAHVIKNVSVTTLTDDLAIDQEALIDLNAVQGDRNRVWKLAAPSVALFSTPEGVRSLLWIQLAELAFKADIPAPVVVPSMPGVSIRKMELITPAKTPSNSGEKKYAGDLRVWTEPTENSQKLAQIPTIINRKEILLQMATMQFHLLLQLQGANPKLELLSEISVALKEISNQANTWDQFQSKIFDIKSESLDVVALRNMAKHTDLEKLLSLSKPNGRLDKLANSSRMELKDEEWASQYRTILESNATGDSGKSWREILVNQMDAPSEEVKQHHKQAEEKLHKTSEGFIAKSNALIREFATRENILMLGGVILYDGLHIATDGASAAWTVSAISNLLGWTLEVPGLGKLASEFAKAGPFMQEAWSATRLSLGIGAALALRPLSIFLIKKYSDRRGDNWNSVKAYFSYGARLLARVNYPIQKLLLEKVFQQKTLYEALEKGQSPFTTGAAWNWPWASKRTIAAKQARIDQKVEQESIKNARSLLIAAILVSRKAAIDPATLLQALTASQGEGVEQYINSLISPEADVNWMAMTAKIYQDLSNLSDRGVGPLNSESIGDYYRLLNDVALEISKETSDKAILDNTKSGRIFTRAGRRAIQKKIKARWSDVQKWTSSTMIPFVFGKQGYEMYQRFKNAEISDVSARIANVQYKEDYKVSTIVYGVADTGLIARAVSLNVPDVARLTCDSMEQNLAYGMVNGVDVETSADTSSTLTNPYPGLHKDWLAPYRVREQTVREGLKLIGKDAIDVDNPRAPNYFKVHQTYMDNYVNQAQVRIMIGVLPSFLGLAVIALSGGDQGATTAGALLTGLGAAFASFPKVAIKLLNKLGFRIDGNGFQPGYATVWPAIRTMMSSLHNGAAAHLTAIEEADELLLSSDINEVKLGAEKMLDLYEQGKTPLPQKFKVHPSKYTFNLAQDLIRYSIQSPENIPLSTKASHALEAGLNIWVGGVISTAIFLEVSRKFFNPDLPLMPQFVDGLITFGATYVGIMLVKAGWQHTVKGIKRYTAPNGWKTFKSDCGTLLESVKREIGPLKRN